VDKDEVKGKLKETEGKVTGDKDRESQGKNQKDYGRAKDKVRRPRRRSPRSL
jgi:uncharacterized protein YjbJ (UPF0337 family)